VDKAYPEFAKVAKEEGFDEIAAAFTKIAEVEQGMRQDTRSWRKTLK